MPYKSTINYLNRVKMMKTWLTHQVYNYNDIFDFDNISLGYARLKLIFKPTMYPATYLILIILSLGMQD